MVRKLKQPSTFRLWQRYESDRDRGNAGKNEPLGVMGTFVVRLAMPVKGEMRRFIHEAEDLVVFAPDLYKEQGEQGYASRPRYSPRRQGVCSTSPPGRAGREGRTARGRSRERCVCRLICPDRDVRGRS